MSILHLFSYKKQGKTLLFSIYIPPATLISLFPFTAKFFERVLDSFVLIPLVIVLLKLTPFIQFHHLSETVLVKTTNDLYLERVNLTKIRLGQSWSLSPWNTLPLGFQNTSFCWFLFYISDWSWTLFMAPSLNPDLLKLDYNKDQSELVFTLFFTCFIQTTKRNHGL